MTLKQVAGPKTAFFFLTYFCRIVVPIHSRGIITSTQVRPVISWMFDISFLHYYIFASLPAYCPLLTDV